MTSVDLHSGLFIHQLLAQTITSQGQTITGTCDTAGFESLEISINHLTASGTFVLTLQESDDTVNWSDVSDDFILFRGEKVNPSDQLPTITNATPTLVRFGYVGKLRYTRLLIGASGTPSSTFIVNGILNTAIHQPTVEQPPAA